MSVGPVDSSSNWQYMQPPSGAQSQWQSILSAASSALGERTSSVQQQLQSGSSLSSIASAQGVSQQTLVSAITSALQQNQQGSGSGSSSSAPSSTQLQQIATNIANGTGFRHHHHRHGGGVAVSGQAPTATAIRRPR